MLMPKLTQSDFDYASTLAARNVRVPSVASLDRFRLNEAATTGHGFFWGEIADWYLQNHESHIPGQLK